jgi:hypothetical protein
VRENRVRWLRRIAYVVGAAALLVMSDTAWADKTSTKKVSTKVKASQKARCQSDADCKDGQTCASDGKCKKIKTSKKNVCQSDADCDAGQFCAADGKCKKIKTSKKNVCQSDDDCKQGESCGDDGKCHKNKECTSDDDCKQGESCGDDGKCHKNKECTSDDDCKQGESCGDDGKCHKNKECTSDDDCKPGQECGEDGKCHKDPPGCDDGDPCTTDTYEHGVCTYTPIPGCGAPTEICGDCIDNDGNGLTDFEDPACCEQLRTASLKLSRGRIVAGQSTSKLRLKSSLRLAGIDPLSQDVFVQLRPAGGNDMLCARVPASHFMRRRNYYWFWAGNPIDGAQGIHDMKIKMRRNGNLSFRIRGQKVQLAGPHQGSVQVTLGFHREGADNLCASTMASFRKARGRVLIGR